MTRKLLVDKKRKKKHYPTRKKRDENRFSREDMGEMDSIIASFILQCLRAFKNYDKHGIPDGFADMDEWNATIQKMIDAFDILKYGRGCSDDEEQIVEQGLDLFREYFRNLWD